MNDRRPNPVRDAEICSRLRAGEDSGRVAADYGITGQRVRQIAAGCGIDLKATKRLLRRRNIRDALRHPTVTSQSELARKLGLRANSGNAILRAHAGMAHLVRPALAENKEARKARVREASLAELRALARRLGYTPSVMDLRKEPRDTIRSFTWYTKEFGGMREAQIAAGLEPNMHGKHKSKVETAATAAE